MRQYCIGQAMITRCEVTFGEVAEEVGICCSVAHVRLAWRLDSARGSFWQRKNNNLPFAERGKNAFTDTLDRWHSGTSVSRSHHRVRHNLSMIRHWLGHGALALFEQTAALDRETDGSNMRAVATALTVIQPSRHAVRYQNTSTVGRPVKTL